MLKIVEFMFSSPLKFIGCFFMLLLILAVIEGAIANICNTIISCKRLKHNQEFEVDIKQNIRNMKNRNT